MTELYVSTSGFYKKTNIFIPVTRLQVYNHNYYEGHALTSNIDELELDFDITDDIFMSEVNDLFMRNLIKFKNLKVLFLSKYDERLFSYEIPDSVEELELHNITEELIFPQTLFPNLRKLGLHGDLTKINQLPNVENIHLDYNPEKQQIDFSSICQLQSGVTFTLNTQEHYSLYTKLFIYLLQNEYVCNIRIVECFFELYDNFEMEDIFEEIVCKYHYMSDEEVCDLVLYHMENQKSNEDVSHQSCHYPKINSNDVLRDYLVHLMYLVYRVIYVKKRRVNTHILNGKINKLYEYIEYPRIRNVTSVFLC